MEELLKRIREEVDPDELIDILELTTDQLCDMLEPYIEEKQSRFDYLNELEKEENDDDDW